MPQATINIYLDSNIIIKLGVPPQSPSLDRINDLQRKGVINVVTTSLTIDEIAKKYTSNDFKLISGIARSGFKKAFSKISDLELPFDNKQDLFEALLKENRKEVTKFHKTLSASVIDIDGVKPSSVFDQYAKGLGVFADGAKDGQVQDAFIFEALKLGLKEIGQIHIVSSDKDFEHLVRTRPKKFKLDATLEEFISRVDETILDEEDIETWLEDNNRELEREFESELNGWAIQSMDVQEGYVEESTLNEIEFIDFQGFGPVKRNGNALIIGRTTVGALLSFTHPNWDEAMYDSEDKVLIPFENVQGDIESDLDIFFSMSVTMKKGKLHEIDEVRFTDETKFIYQDFYDHSHYK